MCVYKFFQRVVFALSFAILSVLGLGFAMGEFGFFGVHAGGEQDGAYRQMRVYAEVLKKIQSDYVTDPNMNKVTAGALHGLLESLDTDSSYLSPTEYKIYKERPLAGEAQIGVTVSKRYGYATVVNVLPGSPADKEKIADGDVFESINGQSTRDLSVAVIRLMLEGKPGTTVEVSVVRPRKADPDKITFTRAVTPLPPMVIQNYEASTILYLKPGELTAQRVDEIAAQLKSAGPDRKVLLDLRDCSGPDEKQGLRLANFFIKQGTLATLQGQRFPAQTFTADPAQFITSAPVSMLVNSGTYGAAELAAADIEDAKRGDVVGERTFGEGSVQKTLDLPDGGAIMLTIAKYESASGKKIQDVAVIPTVAAGPSLDDLFDENAPPAKSDTALAKALDLLKARKG